ncbi:hypothetical protein LINPERPRIM_LOCUS27900 [Linum perenne]
MICSIV